MVRRTPVDDAGERAARPETERGPTLGTPTRLFTAVVAALLVGVGLPAIAAAGWVDAPTAGRWPSLFGCLLSLAAGAVALSVASTMAREGPVGDRRRLVAAAAAIGLGVVVLALGTLAPALFGAGTIGPLDDGRLRPLQVVAMVLLIVGTLFVPTPGRRATVRVIDASLIVLAGLTLLWVAPLRGTVDASGGLVQVLRDDPAMITAVALMLIAATLLVRIDPDEQRAMRPLVIGLLLYPAAFYTAEVARSGSGNAVGEAFVEMYWVTAPVLVLGAALRTAHRVRTGSPATPTPGADTPTVTARVQSALPGVAVVVILIGVASHQWFMGRISPVTMAIGTVTVLLAVGRQAILQRDQQELFDGLRRNAAELAHQARHDRLTGLGNRTALGEHLSELLRRPTPAGVSVFFIDLDNFKAINDSLGHDTGDELLMELSVRLTDVIGASVFRIGGDEFIAVRSDLDGERAEAMAGAVVAALEPPLMVHGRPLAAAASIGLARSRPRRDPGRDTRDTADALLRRADLALYRAKELGRGRWAAYDSSLQDRADRRLELQQGLRRAVDDRALEVVYEPVVSLPDRTVVGAAALLRWTTPHRGILDHDEILAVADEAGLRPQLLDVLLGEVGTRLASTADDPHRPVWISVGIGADDVARTDLPARLSAVLAASRVPPGMLQIEVPEATVADDRAAESLERLVRLGVGLTVTGFGNGPSSLRHLAHYPAPAIEVDRSFVSGIGQRREDRLIVEAVGRLAVELGLDLVGDGVGSQVQAAHLESLGAARASGPLFGRPVPWDEFLRRHVDGVVRR